MSDFADVKIIDLAAPGKWSLNGGPFGSKLVSSMYVDEGIPVIRGANLPMDQRFLDENFVYVSEAKADELRAHTAGPGDVVVTQRGTLGQVGLIPPSARHQRYVISQSQMKLTVNPTVADPGYVYYSFRAPEIIGRFVALASTSGVPHVNLQTLRDFSIPLPPLDTQRRIASILGGYDHLIEVNRRRVAVLEEMARGLFEEWFVRFRFPGHESAPLVDTPDGPLPQGWSKRLLVDLCSRITDGAHRSPPSVDVGKPMASVRDMRDWGFDYSVCRNIEIAEWDELVRGDCLPLVGDILIAKDGANLNKHTFLIWRDEPVVLLSSIAIVRPLPEVEREFLTATLRSPSTDAAIKNMKSGAAIPRIVLKDFKRLPIVWPTAEVRDRFEHLIYPLHQQCRLLVESNQRLAASRNLLLPRLISGQLSVETAKRDLELAA